MPEIDWPLKIGTSVQYRGETWLITDTHWSPQDAVSRVDLRKTAVVDPERRHLDEAVLKRGVPVRDLDAVTRYVVTNLNAAGDLRVLTFPGQGRYTYATRAAAAQAMELHREGLRRVIGDRINTLETRAVLCWAGHYDPKKTVWDPEEDV